LAEVGKAEGDSGAYLEQISRSGNSIPGVVHCCKPGCGLLPLLWPCHSLFVVRLRLTPTAVVVFQPSLEPSCTCYHN